MTPVEAILARLLEHEGGIVDLGDGQGLTRFGQTPGWLATWSLPAPDTPEEAAANYLLWMRRLHLTDLVEVDADLAALVTDWAVHSGHRTAIRALQRLVGTPEDGIIGPMTLTAVEQAPRRRLLRGLLAARTRDVGRLLSSQTVDRRRWAHGWLARLADEIESLP